MAWWQCKLAGIARADRPCRPSSRPYPHQPTVPARCRAPGSARPASQSTAARATHCHVRPRAGARRRAGEGGLEFAEKEAAAHATVVGLQPRPGRHERRAGSGVVHVGWPHVRAGKGAEAAWFRAVSSSPRPQPTAPRSFSRVREAPPRLPRVRACREGAMPPPPAPADVTVTIQTVDGRDVRLILPASASGGAAHTAAAAATGAPPARLTLLHAASGRPVGGGEGPCGLSDGGG